MWSNTLEKLRKARRLAAVFVYPFLVVCAVGFVAVGWLFYFTGKTKAERPKNDL